MEVHEEEEEAADKVDPGGYEEDDPSSGFK